MVSRFGSATVRFTARRIFLLTQVYLHLQLSLRHRLVADVAETVEGVAADVADAGALRTNQSKTLQ